jgi:hypothetical protein
MFIFKTPPSLNDPNACLFYNKFNEHDLLYLNKELLEKLKNPKGIDWWFDWYLSIFPMKEEEWKEKIEKKELDWYAYYCLSKANNDTTIALLMKYPRIINWDALSLNPHPKAIELLTKFQCSINWDYFSNNPNSEVKALYLANPEKVNREELLRNPNTLLRTLFDKSSP